MIKVAIEEWGLYNAGVLACKWWDADADINEINEYYIELRKKHGVTPFEDVELFNADWEGDEFDVIGECTPFEDIFEINEKIDDLDDNELKRVSYMVSQCGYDLDDAIANFEDCELYENMTLKDLAENFVDEGLYGEINESIKYHIDYDSIAYELGMDYSEYDGDIYRCN